MAEWIESKQSTAIGIGFACTSIFLSGVHIMQHLSHFSMPQIQTYVIRILLICPIYAISSMLALILGENGLYAEIVRDIYEAIVIYSFFSLILEYCGGETDCIYQIENEGLSKMPCPLCCLKPRPKNARFMRFCFRGVLQFVVMKPLVAVIDLSLLASGNYHNVVWQAILLTIYNISYVFALYCLFVFYTAVHDLIRNFRPLAKFLSVKAIIFATYYQSLLVSLLAGQGTALVTREQATRFNDLILCVEMVLFSAALLIAFPVKDYIGGIPNRGYLGNVKDVFTVRDIYQNVYHNFMPAYRDYALQRSQGEAPEVVRLQTFFAGNLDRVALEMTTRYRGKSRRMAFNSLLRSGGIIRSKMRSNGINVENQSQRELDEAIHLGEDTWGDFESAGDSAIDEEFGKSPLHTS